MSHRRATAFLLTFFLLTLTVFGQSAGVIPAPGVPYTLAQQRATILKDIRYDLFFGLPDPKDGTMLAGETIHFFLTSIPPSFLAIDFRSSPNFVVSVHVNGKKSKTWLENEHLLIPATELKVGEDSVRVSYQTNAGGSITMMNFYIPCSYRIRRGCSSPVLISRI